MIRGYPEQPSPVAGGSLVLRVATDAPQFRVEFYRCGAQLVLHGSSGWLPGHDAPSHLACSDWGEPGVGLRGEPLAPWAGYPLPVPAHWRSGVYALRRDAAPDVRPLGRPVPGLARALRLPGGLLHRRGPAPGGPRRGAPLPAPAQRRARRVLDRRHAGGCRGPHRRRGQRGVLRRQHLLVAHRLRRPHHVPSGSPVVGPGQVVGPGSARRAGETPSSA